MRVSLKRRLLVPMMFRDSTQIPGPGMPTPVTCAPLYEVQADLLRPWPVLPDRGVRVDTSPVAMGLLSIRLIGSRCSHRAAGLSAERIGHSCQGFEPEVRCPGDIRGVWSPYPCVGPIEISAPELCSVLRESPLVCSRAPTEGHNPVRSDVCRSGRGRKQVVHPEKREG